MNQTNQTQRRPTDTRITFVVAGDYSEFLKYQLTQPKVLRWVSNPQVLYGRTSDNMLMKIGSWHARDDIDEIDAMAKRFGITEVRP